MRGHELSLGSVQGLDAVLAVSLKVRLRTLGINDLIKRYSR
jgi:hypothetical protein